MDHFHIVEKGLVQDMERFLMRFSLKLFFLVLLCFLGASSSWAQQESPFQSEPNHFLSFGHETLSQEDELPALEQETPLEKEESLPPQQKIPPEKKRSFLPMDRRPCC